MSDKAETLTEAAMAVRKRHERSENKKSCEDQNALAPKEMSDSNPEPDESADKRRRVVSEPPTSGSRS
jgi:hypothetical protein